MSRTVATTRRARTPLLDIDKAFHEFLYHWGIAKDAGTLRDKAKVTIRKWLDANKDSARITQNENGSLAVEFDEVKEIGGRKFRGIENRRTVRHELDLDLIDEYLDGLSAAKRAELSKQLYKPVTDMVFQPDELFRLNQEGKISDDVLESFYSDTETWALNVLTA